MPMSEIDKTIELADVNKDGEVHIFFTNSLDCLQID